ncbi:MAG: YceI family protein [Phycisphaerae bacterium]
MRDWAGRFLMYSMCGLCVCGTARAASQTFDFKDRKGVNAVSFVLDSVVEPIMGLAKGISGEIEFDPKKAKSMTGQITIAADSIRPSHEGMVKVLHSAGWLDVEHQPNVTFEIDRVRAAKKKGRGVWNMKVVGALTLKGVTKKMTVPIKASYIKGGLAKRMRGQKGDLLVLRSNFTIKRADFGIKPDMGGDVVAEDIEIRVIIVGGAPEE